MVFKLTILRDEINSFLLIIKAYKPLNYVSELFEETGIRPKEISIDPNFRFEYVSQLFIHVTGNDGYILNLSL